MAQGRWRWLTVQPRCQEIRQEKASSSNWQMNREIEWIDRTGLLLLRLQIHGCLFLFVSVVITQAPTGAAGREMKAPWKPGHEQSQKTERGRPTAWTPSHDRQPFGAVLFSCQELFRICFICFCLPHPPARPPLWMVLQMICVQFGSTWANTASKSRHTLPPFPQSAHLSCAREAVKPLFYLQWVCLPSRERSP